MTLYFHYRQKLVCVIIAWHIFPQNKIVWCVCVCFFLWGVFFFFFFFGGGGGGGGGGRLLQWNIFTPDKICVGMILLWHILLPTKFGVRVIISWHYIFTADKIWSRAIIWPHISTPEKWSVVDNIATSCFYFPQSLVWRCLYRDIIFSFQTTFIVG